MCTNILLKSIHSVVSARTMDFGGDFKTRLSCVPRNQINNDYLLENKALKELIESFWKNISKRKTWRNDYGYLSTHALISSKLTGSIEIPTCMDGMNEKGLSGATLWMPCTQFPKKSSSIDNILSIHLIDYILGTCVYISDVKRELSKVNVIHPEFIPSKKVPQHFIFSDNKGDSIVVEFENGKVVTHFPSNGVLTNAPFYTSHLEHLDHFNSLTFHNTQCTNCTNEKGEEKPIQETNGSGMYGVNGQFGLPGDSTPKSRFVRASKYSAVNFNPKTSQEAVTRIWQIIETLQVPEGSILPKLKKCIPFSIHSEKPDHTKWVVIREHKGEQGLNYFFYTKDNPTLNKISLNDMDWDTTSNKNINFESNTTNWFYEICMK